MSINEDTSFIEYPVEQPTQDFVTNFDTIGGTTDVVLVTVDGVLTDTDESSYTVQQINHTTWRVTPEVQVGSVVRLYRVTNIDEMMHVFTAGAKFIARNMDSNFKQIRHAQQEVRDGFSKLATDTYAVIAGLDEALELAQDAAQDAQDAAVIAQDAADIVNAIIVDGKVVAANVLDESGKTQQEVNNSLRARGFVTPFDFGYSGGDDDYGYYLQLAIDSGRNVCGAPSPTSVKSSTIVSISKSGQSVDLSMIEELEWLGNYPLYGDATTLNKAIGVINIKPSIVQSSDLALNLSESTTVSVLPVEESNIIIVGAHNYAVGDLLIFQMRYPTGAYDAWKVGTVTAITATTVETDYHFAYVPTTLTVHKAKEVCEGINLRMPLKVIDNSGATLVGNLVSGCGVVYARNCEIYGTELLNGANHAISYARSTRCKDYSFQCTSPRMVGGGQGYTASVVASTYILTHDPINTHGRHVLDWTSSGYCKSYRPRAYDMQQIPITTHGVYEHDCEYIDADIGDCSHLTGGRAVSIGSSGAEFGERSKRIVGIRGVLRGAIYVHPLASECHLKNSIKFVSENTSNLSPSGGLIVSADFNGSVNLQATVDNTGDVTFDNSQIGGTLDIRAGVADIKLIGGSYQNITTSTSAKPRNILIGGADMKPTFSPVIEALDTISLHSSTKVTGSLPTVTLVLKASVVSVDSSVELHNSTGLTSQASEDFNFFGSILNPISGRVAGLLQQSTSGANVRVSGTIKAFSPSSLSLYIGASVTPSALIVTGGYIEGTTNLSTNASITRCVVANNTVKDDATLRAATSSSGKVFQNNIY